MQRVAFEPEHVAVFGLANARGVRQHLAEGLLQVARRAANDLQYLRGGGLLLRSLVERAGEPRDLGCPGGARLAATARRRRCVAAPWRCRLAVLCLGACAG